ncbi:MAG: cytochrome C oxidase subunit IV family protein [SAR202 cluster bacterium]|nr:cytochrome C oxidase subunit IV family protein [SAR202 cluster bacterium]
MERQTVDEAGHSEKKRRGLRVIVALAILTAVEFWVAVSMETGLFAVLAVIAMIKTALIVEYFMHYSQLWHRSEEGPSDDRGS